jgi:hypothetical protein
MPDIIALLFSEKSAERMKKQKPMDKIIVERVKKSLAMKNIFVEQSEEWDKYLIDTDKEAITFSTGDIIMHTNISASGFYEELIHYGQIKNRRVIYDDKENEFLMEIEAQNKLIKHQKSYKITDYEIEILKENLCKYEAELEELRRSINV